MAIADFAHGRLQPDPHDHEDRLLFLNAKVHLEATSLREKPYNMNIERLIT